MKSTDIISSSPLGDGPLRLPRRKLPPLVDIALPAVAIGSGAMLFLAVPNLIDGNDLWSYAKAFTLALSATVVSFAVNKLAIERGAPLATKGYLGATAVSIGSILAVGGGLFAATYSGLVLKDVAELQLQQHGAALSEFVGHRSAAAAAGGRVSPVIRSIAGDLAQKAVCEVEQACISGRGGGRGPVARVVEEHAGRAASIAQQIAAGDIVREQAVTRLNEQIAEYQSTLGEDGHGVWERRAELQTLDAKMRQTIAELDEAVPLALIAAYAAELRKGVTVTVSPEAETRLNGILSRHGEALASVIGSIDAQDTVAPTFPRRTGVSDTFSYIAHFLPVAAITAVVELIFPIVLWAYTFWALAWEIHKHPSRDTHRDDDRGGSRPRPRHGDPSRNNQGRLNGGAHPHNRHNRDEPRG